jgi:hypothetical protein
MLINKTNKNISILNARGIDSLVSCKDVAILSDINAFIQETINSINNSISILPSNPGFELHPYKNILVNSDTKKYIIGTFPPISYLIDNLREVGIEISQLKQPTFPNQVINEPQIPFFHGNVSGLWSVLLTQIELEELNAIRKLNRHDAKLFLVKWLIKNQIFYDDIIEITQRKFGKLKPHDNLGYTYEDVNLIHICPDLNLVYKVLSNENLKVICFTNGKSFGSGNSGGIKLSKDGMVNTKDSDALSLFLRTCQNLGMKIEMQCLPHFSWLNISELSDNQKRTKIIFEVRITKTNECKNKLFEKFTQKVITIMTPYSPAAHGNIENHPIVLSLKNYYGMNYTAIKILPKIYEKFKDNTYHDLYQFNINE